MLLLCNPSLSLQSSFVASILRKPNNHSSLTISITNSASSGERFTTRRRTISAFEARISLVFALASQANSLSQRLLAEVATETAKYLFPKRFESRSLEEALMAVPDLESFKFKVLSRRDQYEIREVEPYFVAETTMPGKSGFDFNGASRSFNVLAEYLFGKNTTKEKMEMTTPVFTSKNQSDGVKMDMTTPVITTKMEDQDQWKMSFLLPSKYGANLPLPKDSSVKIKEIPRKVVAVVSFSGWLKWRKAPGVICDSKIPKKLEGKFYRTAIRPAMLYGSECWVLKGQQKKRVGVAEMRMLRWMCVHTRLDKIMNEYIRNDVGVVPIEAKMTENRLRWLGHVQRRL